MAYVTVNVMSVAAANAAEFVARFAARPGRIESVDGFERFELLRPADGRDRWLVVTHWRDESAYRAWSAARSPRTDSVADSHEVWAFDVEQVSEV